MRTVAQVSAVVAAFVIIEVLGAQPAFAQGMKWRGSGGWGPGGQYMRCTTRRAWKRSRVRL
jgi:hypothetical protein